MSDYRNWLDNKRMKEIEEFKIKHPAQYYCITEQAKEQGALEELKELINLDSKSDIFIDSEGINFICKKIKELEGCEKQ